MGVCVAAPPLMHLLAKHAAIAAATGILTVTVMGSARADDVPAPPVDQWGDRTLAGHTFLFPGTHRGAFVTTDFGIALGAYQESIPSVPLPFGGTADLSILGAITTATLGVKITDWLGVQASGAGLAVFGANGSSLLYAGGKLNAGGNVAPIVRLARIRSTGTQLSARAQLGWLAGDALDLPRFLVLGRTVIASLNSAPDATAAAAGIARG
ncbi:MAG TPA: hypothetical protein VH137_02660, partial [Gemmatimonadales bacterium]|nr:hypothetical protein [Gemmatimonadales bacterium]